jgi:hypothetical protein
MFGFPVVIGETGHCVAGLVFDAAGEIGDFVGEAVV